MWYWYAKLDFGVYRYISKDYNIMKKVNISCDWFQKEIAQSEIFQAFISWSFDYGLQIMKTQNYMSQNIRILHKINKNKLF